MQHRLMGQPIIPTNPAYQQQQYNLAAMQQQQNNLMRAQQLGGQLILSPRLATPSAGMPGAVQTSQQQALMGMPPTMVSSSDVNSAGSVLYSAATLQNPAAAALVQGQTADFSQYGLMNQALLDYNPAAVDPSAAGMSTYRNLANVRA